MVVEWLLEVPTVTFDRKYYYCCIKNVLVIVLVTSRFAQLPIVCTEDTNLSAKTCHFLPELHEKVQHETRKGKVVAYSFYFESEWPPFTVCDALSEFHYCLAMLRLSI